MLLQRPDIAGRERLAIRLRLCEKQILSQTMDAVRRRLAPIRGIPIKSGGMADPNADLKEVFDFIDDLPNKPKKFLDTIGRWAKGDFVSASLQQPFVCGFEHLVIVSATAIAASCQCDCVLGSM